ncbi:hypothetical protein QN372_00165 [Undibacterium sp. RTI2.1]|uniref:hypothetical protein n=1 Tax=unclassified Undibacterium TaxID=2630295 RepID=UPI002AB5DCE6|nr:MULTISPECIES: hypothetical protein [unclassified Undibacterium]MDY7537555.1 hypothetical protein [Undibacterium sp. 5I1]MEB0029152.1 hypothetical protein [Undibacterium sp. RTI2.1]MEB0115460.1 hypothetical protein [Undibacterium sp. RTI2.2]MEB0231940.1 hypothetical protein [Undibacterium sp. 10I3]MEB0256291.1 hypothetical protein [Undibacterium sp. 5I1]
MKATINSKGVLTVMAETELEAYALRMWCVQNYVQSPNISETTVAAYMVFKGESMIVHGFLET